MRSLFEGLRHLEGPSMAFRLFKGDGAARDSESVLGTPRRDGWMCRSLGLLRGTPLYWEYVFFALLFALRAVILRERFDCIYCIEPMVARTVTALRAVFPGRPRIVFTHSVWMEPRDYVALADCIHEVNVENFEKMRRFVEENGLKTELVFAPHFLQSPDARSQQSPFSRTELGLHTRFVALSVGVIDSDHKRTDHVIREIAAMGPDWSLLACGAPKGTDGERVMSLGRELLGSRFVQLSLPREDVERVYPIADAFVLGALNEGFGIVILEAMKAGLPVIAHDRQLFRWIIGDDSACVPMDRAGALAAKLEALANDPSLAAAMGSANRRRFLDCFTWPSVRGTYLGMMGKPGAADTNGPPKAA